MAAPKTKGVLRTKLEEMEIGDYIAATYTTSAMTAIGTFSELGNVPDDQEEFTSTNLKGTVYLMKVDMGLLLCTNRTMAGVQYAVLNKANLIAGKKVELDGHDFIKRVPSIEELNKANSTMDGLMDTADRYTNFGTSVGSTEMIQEHFNMTPGSYTWNTTPGVVGNATASDTARAVRFVLAYCDNAKSTDVFH